MQRNERQSAKRARKTKIKLRVMSQKDEKRYGIRKHLRNTINRQEAGLPLRAGKGERLQKQHTMEKQVKQAMLHH